MNDALRKVAWIVLGGLGLIALGIVLIYLLQIAVGGT